MNAYATQDAGLKTLEIAHAYLREAAAAVPADAWDNATPCDQWTVRQVLNHARLDQQAYGYALTGEDAPETDAFRPADTLTTDHAARLGHVLTRVHAAYAGLPAGTADVSTPLGPLPAGVAASAAALDAGVHAWDIAVATGQDHPLGEELAEGLWVAAERLADTLRDAYRVFAPARTVDPAEGRAAQLLGFLGRDPHWVRPA
ncbi:TIGR03086 family metal-binding protein [Streptomyces sp. NPDC001941]|uniref:TIGR03086 family metal-binding protein n=1 Tax=Streptomyces sp. NPDC001941 TaxID=3154659 RepID=UPI003322E126